MKRNIFLKGWKVIIFLLVLTNFANGQISKIVSFKMSDIERTTSKKIGNKYENLSMELAFSSEDVGKPNLPIIYYKFYIPKGKTASGVSFQSSSQSDLQLNFDVIPIQHPILISMAGVDTLFDAPDVKVYGQDLLYPAKQAKILRSDFIDGNMEVVTVAVFPIQYNPLQRKIKMTTSGLLTITTTSSVSSSLSLNNHANSQIMVDIVKSLVENPNDVSFANLTTTKNIQKTKMESSQTIWTVPFYEYVVITTRALKPSFTKLISWKKRKGYNAGVVCMEDILADPAATGDPLSPTLTDDAGKLRQYLMAGYANIYPKTKYALLGGDNTIIPIRYGSGDGSLTNWNSGFSKIPSDLYFSNFTSNWTAVNTNMTGQKYSGFDYGPQIFVGRLLCNSETDVANWTTKLLLYEQNPGNGDYSYLSKSLFTEADYINSDYYGLSKFLSSSLPSIFTSKTSWNELPSDAAAAPNFPKGNDVISELNKHYGLYCVFNHGGPCNFGTATYGNWSSFNGCPSGICPCNYAIYANKSYTGGSNYTETANGFEDLTNYNFPTIIYSASCQNMPFDNSGRTVGFRTLGEAFTVMYKGGGPAYMGNTRDGYVGKSQDLETAFFNSIKSFPQLGISEGNSKVGFYDHFTCLTHNLIGCPEMSMWTATPSSFNGVSITESGTNVTVNSGGVVADKICITSALNDGYFQVQTNQQSCTFTNVSKPYFVTITKTNYIPSLNSLQAVYIQNKNISSTTYLNCQTASLGYNVDVLQTPGNVVIQNGANIVLDATGDILLDKGFEVQLGATFEAK